MISVFAGFMLAPDATIKSLGFALAFGIAVDAFLVRMTHRAGRARAARRRAWWLPALAGPGPARRRRRGRDAADRRHPARSAAGSRGRPRVPSSLRSGEAVEEVGEHRRIAFVSGHAIAYHSRRTRRSH